MENSHIEVEHLKSIFKFNDCPVNKKWLEKFSVPKKIVPTVLKRKLLIVLPFLGKCSTNLRNHLYKSINKKKSN